MAHAAARNPKRYLFFLLLVVLAIYVIIPQAGSLHSSWHLLSHPKLKWLAAACGLTLATYLAAAGTYYFLSFKPLRYKQLVLIEMAAMFINRLLPAGVGALGTNYAYLRRRHHSQAQSAIMVAANNLLGVLGHGMILALGVLVYGTAGLPAGSHRSFNRVEELVALVILLGLGVVLLLAKPHLASWFKRLRQTLRAYSARPHKLLAGLATSMALTFCNLFCLQACALALGIQLSFMTVLVVFSFGVGAATAVPTPGGLGGFEAGLFAALVAFHTSSPTALALTLLYRLVSFWLPLLAGAVALAVSEQQQLL